MQKHENCDTICSLHNFNISGQHTLAKAFLASQSLELSAPEDIPTDVEKWYGITQKIRDVVTAEFFASPEYLTLSDNERFEAVKAQVKKADEKLVDFGEYVEGLFRRYLENKPRKAEYIEAVKQLMKDRNR